MHDSLTFLDALVRTLIETGSCNSLEMVAPAAVLWPAAAREWEPLLPLLRDHLSILISGAYAPDDATGPHPGPRSLTKMGRRMGTKCCTWELVTRQMRYQCVRLSYTRRNGGDDRVMSSRDLREHERH